MLSYSGSIALAAPVETNDTYTALYNIQAAFADLDKVFSAPIRKAPLGTVRPSQTLSRNGSSFELSRQADGDVNGMRSSSEGGILRPVTEPVEIMHRSGTTNLRGPQVGSPLNPAATTVIGSLQHTRSGTHLPALERTYTITPQTSLTSEDSISVSCQASSAASASTSQSSDCTTVNCTVVQTAGASIRSKQKIKPATSTKVTFAEPSPRSSVELLRNSPSPTGSGWSLNKSFTRVVVRNTSDLTWSEQVQVATCDVPRLRAIKVLGRGTYGVVEAVEVPVSLGKAFIAARKHCSDQDQVAFLNETNALMACRDTPFIIQIFQDHEEPMPKGGVEHYALMELARYGNLAQVISSLAHARTQAGKADKEPIMPEAKLRYYAAVMVTALDALESRQIAHRDIKPENVLIGDRGIPKLADFGLATRIPDVGTTLDDIAGTLHYLAPEVMQRATTRASDWWSLGVLLLELTVGLTTRRAVHRLRTRKYSWPSYISPVLRDLLSRMLDPSPKKRLQHAADARTHPFFAGLDWDALPNKSGPYTAPDVLVGRSR